MVFLLSKKSFRVQENHFLTWPQPQARSILLPISTNFLLGGFHKNTFVFVFIFGVFCRKSEPTLCFGEFHKNICFYLWTIFCQSAPAFCFWRKITKVLYKYYTEGEAKFGSWHQKHFQSIVQKEFSCCV